MAEEEEGFAKTVKRGFQFTADNPALTTSLKEFKPELLDYRQALDERGFREVQGETPEELEAEFKRLNPSLDFEHISGRATSYHFESRGRQEEELASSGGARILGELGGFFAGGPVELGITAASLAVGRGRGLGRIAGKAASRLGGKYIAQQAAFQSITRLLGFNAYGRLATSAATTPSVGKSVARGAIAAAAVNIPLEAVLQATIAAGRVDRKEASYGDAVIEAAKNVAFVGGGSAVLGGTISGLGKAFKVNKADAQRVRGRINKQLGIVAKHRGNGEELQARRAGLKILKEIVNPLQKQYTKSTNADERAGIIEALKIVEDATPGAGGQKIQAYADAIRNGRDLLAEAAKYETNLDIGRQATIAGKELEAGIETQYETLGFARMTGKELAEMPALEGGGKVIAGNADGRVVSPRLIIDYGKGDMRLLTSKGESLEAAGKQAWTYTINYDRLIAPYVNVSKRRGAPSQVDFFKEEKIFAGIQHLNETMAKADTIKELTQAYARTLEIFGEETSTIIFHAFSKPTDDLSEVITKGDKIYQKKVAGGKLKASTPQEARDIFDAVRRVYNNINLQWVNGRNQETMARDTGRLQEQINRKKAEIVIPAGTRSALEAPPTENQIPDTINSTIAISDALRNHGEALIEAVKVGRKESLDVGAADREKIDMALLLSQIDGVEDLGKIQKLRGEVLPIFSPAIRTKIAQRLLRETNGNVSNSADLLAALQKSVLEESKASLESISSSRSKASGTEAKLATPDEIAKEAGELAALTDQLKNYLKSDSIVINIQTLVDKGGFTIEEATIRALDDMIQRGLTDGFLYANSTAKTAQFMANFLGRIPKGLPKDGSLMFERMFIPSNGDRTFNSLNDFTEEARLAVLRSLEVETQDPESGLGWLSVIGPRVFTRRPKVRTKEFTIEELEKEFYKMGSSGNQKAGELMGRLREWEKNTLLPMVEKAGVPIRFRENYYPTPARDKSKLSTAIDERAKVLKANENELAARFAKEDGTYEKITDEQLEALAFKEIWEDYFVFRSVDNARSAPGFTTALERGYWRSMHGKEVSFNTRSSTKIDTHKAGNSDIDIAKGAEVMAFGESETLTKTADRSNKSTRSPLEGLTGERVWHIKDFRAWKEFDKRYGTGQSMPELYHLHLTSISEGLGQIKMLGPAPELTVSMLASALRNSAKDLTQSQREISKTNIKKGLNYFNTANKIWYSPENANDERIAIASTTFRSLAIMTKLGLAPVHSLPDFAGQHGVANLITGAPFDPGVRKTLTGRGLPALAAQAALRRSFFNFDESQKIRLHHVANKRGGIIDATQTAIKEMKAVFADDIKRGGRPYAVQQLVQHGIFIETMIDVSSSTQSHHRFTLGSDFEGFSKAARMARTGANLTLRGAGLSQLTENGQIAIKQYFLNDIGSNVSGRVSWDNLGRRQAWLKSFGIGRDEWETLLIYGRPYSIRRSHGKFGDYETFDFFSLLVDAEAGKIKGINNPKDPTINERMLKVARGIHRGVRDSSTRSIPQAGERELVSTGLIGSGRRSGDPLTETGRATVTFHGYAASIWRHQIWSRLLNLGGRGTPEFSGKSPRAVASKSRVATTGTQTTRQLEGIEQDEIAKGVNPLSDTISFASGYLAMGFLVYNLGKIIKDEALPDLTTIEGFKEALDNSGANIWENIDRVAFRGYGNNLFGPNGDILTDIYSLVAKAGGAVLRGNAENFTDKNKNDATDLVIFVKNWWWIQAALNRISFEEIEKSWKESRPLDIGKYFK